MLTCLVKGLKVILTQRHGFEWVGVRGEKVSNTWSAIKEKSPCSPIFFNVTLLASTYDTEILLKDRRNRFVFFSTYKLSALASTLLAK